MQLRISLIFEEYEDILKSNCHVIPRGLLKESIFSLRGVVTDPFNVFPA